MALSEYRVDLAYEIAFWSMGLEDADYPIDELGRLSLELSDKLRVLAIITLLTEGEVDHYYHILIRAALTRVKYLEKLSSNGITDDFHQGSARYEPLLNTIAANDFEVASRIVKLSPNDFRTETEYLDDYCYAQLLHQIVTDTASEESTESLFVDFEDFLDGDSSSRLDVCRAVVLGDQASFDEAFESLLDDHELEIVAAKARGQIENPGNMAQRQLFVEGLALLRIAERKGLATATDYRFCPGIARVPMVVPFPEEE